LIAKQGTSQGSLSAGFIGNGNKKRNVRPDIGLILSDKVSKWHAYLSGVYYVQTYTPEQNPTAFDKEQ